MASEPEWIKIEDFSDLYDEGHVTYSTNDQTQVEISSDFATSINFEDAFFSRFNVNSQDEVEASGGEQTAVEFFTDFCVMLAGHVTAGEWKIFWITCEDEDYRIDLSFMPGSCKFRVHEDASD